MANTLYFDIELMEEDFREIIKKAIRSKEIVKEFGEIHLVPVTSDLNSQIQMPAVYIEVQNDGANTATQEDIEVERFSKFSVILETYANGGNRRIMNRKLARFIANQLEVNQPLKHYYNRGLRLIYDRELSSFIDGVNRRQVRFSAIVDNASKLIYNKER